MYWMLDTGSRPNKLFKERVSKTFEDLCCNSDSYDTCAFADSPAGDETEKRSLMSLSFASNFHLRFDFCLKLSQDWNRTKPLMRKMEIKNK